MTEVIILMLGARGGNRTRTTFGQGILSPSRLPIPPPAHINFNSRKVHDYEYCNYVQRYHT